MTSAPESGREWSPCAGSVQVKQLRNAKEWNYLGMRGKGGSRETPPGGWHNLFGIYVEKAITGGEGGTEILVSSPRRTERMAAVLMTSRLRCWYAVAARRGEHGRYSGNAAKYVNAMHKERPVWD